MTRLSKGELALEWMLYKKIYSFDFGEYCNVGGVVNVWEEHGTEEATRGAFSSGFLVE